MAETYLLRGARQLLTLQGPAGARRGASLAELSIIPDGAVLIRNGIIEEVGMSRRVENLAAARNAKIIDATGHVVMPAFVDSGVSLVHSHHSAEKNDERQRTGLPVTPSMQREDILDAARALKLVSKKRLILRASQIAASMVKAGTGTAGVVTGYGLDDTGEVKSLRSIEAVDGKPLETIPTFLGANTVPAGFTPLEFAQQVLCRLTSTVAHRKLAGIAAVRCGPMAFDYEAARSYLRAAQEFGLRAAIYAQQFEPDNSVRLMLEMNAISLTHLEHISDRDIELLADTEAIAVLTPAATLHMGLTRFAPARKLIAEGAAVALSSAFNPDQCPTFSMHFVIAMACRYLGMTAAEAIVAATLNSAHAIGCAKRIGSIETGKQADLLVLNARDYRELPQTPGLNLVKTIIKAGHVVN